MKVIEKKNLTPQSPIEHRENNIDFSIGSKYNKIAQQPTSLSAPASQPGTDAGFSALRLGFEQLRGPVGGSHRRRFHDAYLMAVALSLSLSLLHGLMLLGPHRIAPLIDHTLGMQTIQGLFVLFLGLNLLVQ